MPRIDWAARWNTVSWGVLAQRPLHRRVPSVTSPVDDVDPRLEALEHERGAAARASRRRTVTSTSSSSSRRTSAVPRSP